jgi:phage terminase small subunit
MGTKRITEKTIRKDLLQQLTAMGKATHTNVDRVEEYIRQWRMAMDLHDDIKKRGVIYQDYDSRGNYVWKDNASVKTVLAVSKEMTNILKSLGLDAPVDIRAGGDDL